MSNRFKETLDSFLTNPDPHNKLCEVAFSDGIMIKVYPKSVNRMQDQYLFIGRDTSGKALWITGGDIASKFVGTEKNGLRRCQFSHENAELIRKLFPFTRPVLIGLDNSIGCGDRLGIANSGHIRAVAGSGLKVILAQQSVRELERTKREAEDVMDSALWAVFQEGYKEGFGADADHLKTEADIDRYAKAGFTMFTLDIGLYVVNEAVRLLESELRQRVLSLPWDVLNDSLEKFIERYKGKQFAIASNFTISPTEDSTLRALVKYGAGIAQTVKLVNYIKTRWSNQPFEIELSVDETDIPTTPLEHFIVANELKRLGIQLVSLAPRFIGDFEKGVEYKGDLKKFKDEYEKHVLIAEKMGPYKISIHSGSDKFDVYRVVGSLGYGRVHVKTAGTSWLEALRTISQANPELFREILKCACENYENDRKSYHVTAVVEKMRDPKDYSNAELTNLLSDDNARQILHVTFGSVVSKKDEKGDYIFKDRIIKCLDDNEDLHYQNLIKHFKRHIEPITSLK